MLSEIRGATTISGGKISISKTNLFFFFLFHFFAQGMMERRALAAFYVHFKLSALAVSHHWAQRCENDPLCCKRDEPSPVERRRHNLSAVRL